MVNYISRQQGRVTIEVLIFLLKWYYYCCYCHTIHNQSKINVLKVQWRSNSFYNSKNLKVICWAQTFRTRYRLKSFFKTLCISKGVFFFFIVGQKSELSMALLLTAVNVQLVIAIAVWGGHCAKGFPSVCSFAVVSSSPRDMAITSISQTAIWDFQSKPALGHQAQKS